MSDEVVIVGKTNVGKSLLFNKLIGQKKSLVIDYHGVTRDIMSGVISNEDNSYIRIYDTGGFQIECNDEIYKKTESKIYSQIVNSKLVLFVVSAQDEISSIEHNILSRLRKLNKRIFLIINKSDLLKKNQHPNDYLSLGLDDSYILSARENIGLEDLKKRIFEIVPLDYTEYTNNNNIIFLGKPNSGKSTLINTLIKDQKIITSDISGSTIDIVESKLKYRNKSFVLKDSAGIVKKSQTKSLIKKYSINNTITHLHESDLCVFVIDGSMKISKQDKSLLELIHTHRIPYFIVVNKIDLLEPNELKNLKKEINILESISLNAPILFISALKNKNIKKVKDKIYVMISSITKKYKTSLLNKILKHAIDRHPPPLINNKRVKLKFIKQTDTKHLAFEVAGSMANKLSKSYVKYLHNYFINSLKIEGIPLKITFVNQKNPFK